jgi:hypothetical protein
VVDQGIDAVARELHFHTLGEAIELPGGSVKVVAPGLSGDADDAAGRAPASKANWAGLARQYAGSELNTFKICPESLQRTSDVGH